MRKKWTYEACYKEAMLYEYQWQFRHNSPVAYCIARRNGWIKDFYWLKKANGTDKPISIYAYEDNDNKVVYVGLSVNVNERHYRHKNGILQDDGSRKYDVVGEYFISIGKEMPKPIIKMEDLYDDEDGQYYEDWYRQMYADCGWTVLNIAKTGIGSSSVGGCKRKWTEDTIREAAKCCISRTDFMEKFSGAYSAACSLGIIDELFSSKRIHRKKKWTEEEVRKEAKRYNTKTDFYKGSKTAYQVAYSLGIVDELFPNGRKPKGYWNVFEHHIEEAKGCKTKMDYYKKNACAYFHSLDNGFIDLLFEDKSNKKHPNGYWTKERVIEAASEYKTKADFHNGNKGAYAAAKRNDWFEFLTYNVA